MEAYTKGITKVMKKVTGDEDYKFGDYTKGTVDVLSFGIKSLRNAIPSASPLDNKSKHEHHQETDDSDELHNHAETDHFDEEVWLFEDELPLYNNQNLLADLEEKKEPLPNPDVIFIGGGPVGLWTAIQLKIYNPSAKILVFEKYATYQRSHVLLLSKSSFKNGLKKHAADKKGADGFFNMISKFEKVIRTNDLENRLIEFAKSLDIHIVIENIASVDSLCTRFPSAKVIVGNAFLPFSSHKSGSDGSHSLVQKEVFNGELQERESLQCIVDLKYEVYGKGEKLDMVSEAYPTLKIMKHVAEEHVGKERNGLAIAYLQF